MMKYHPRHTVLLLAPLCLLIACEAPGVDECDLDDDGDRALACGGTDCDDANPDTFGGAFEICDGFDNDCDGLYAGFDETDGEEYEDEVNEVDSDRDGVLNCEDCDPIHGEIVGIVGIDCED